VLGLIGTGLAIIAVAVLLALFVHAGETDRCTHGVLFDRTCAQCDETERHCGCRYVLYPGEVRYTARCETHRPMCRPIEPWELELLLGTDHDCPDAEFDERRLP
jgi:hypothetical protein